MIIGKHRTTGRIIMALGVCLFGAAIAFAVATQVPQTHHQSGRVTNVSAGSDEYSVTIGVTSQDGLYGSWEVPRSENLEVGDYTGYYETSDGRISGYEFTQSYPVLAAYIAMLIGGVVLSLYGLVVYTKPRPASKE